MHSWADRTPLEESEDLMESPVAYGLPRDEGSRLPYIVPELDGAPFCDHERLRRSNDQISSTSS